MEAIIKVTGTGSESPMDEHELFSGSLYEEQMRLAGREVFAFTGAVMKLFGPEQARAATDDWLAEMELMDSRARSTSRDWRSLTIAATVRLVSRIDAAQHRQKCLAESNNGRTSPLPACDCFSQVPSV